MLSEQLNITNFLLVAIIIWFALLSSYLLKTVSHYKKLIRGADNIDLQKVLENIIEKQAQEEKHISQINKSLQETQKRALSHFQKSALIRFNPFEDAGGDQSFSLALLDEVDNGVVISSLHSRSGTRIYAKSVITGRHSAHAFTKEEKEVVEKAVKQGKIKENNTN